MWAMSVVGEHAHCAVLNCTMLTVLHCITADEKALLSYEKIWTSNINAIAITSTIQSVKCGAFRDELVESGIKVQGS